MNHLTPEPSFKILEICFVKDKSVHEVHRTIRPFYGHHNQLSEKVIRVVVDRLRTNFTLHQEIESKKCAYRREKYAEISISHHCELVGLCPSIKCKLLRKDLGLHAYKIPLLQELKTNDHRLRGTFADGAHLKLAEDEYFYRRFLSQVFSDEAHFWLNGSVNKQSCHISSKDNPQAINDSPLGCVVGKFIY